MMTHQVRVLKRTILIGVGFYGMIPVSGIGVGVAIAVVTPTRRRSRFARAVQKRHLCKL
jgi:hypothetical protein